MTQTKSPQEITFTTINGVKTAEYITGLSDGIPVLALHGWGANISLMQPLADALARQGFRVFVPDMPGFGQSDPPPVTWNVSDYAHWVIAYLDAHGLAQVHLIGHSFGGRLGLILGADYASRLHRLALIDSAGVPPRRPLGSRLRLNIYKAIRDGLYKIGMKSTADNLRAWYTNRYGSADFKSAGVLRETFVKVVNENLLPYAARISVPTLLIWGDADDDTPLWQAKMLEKTIPDAGLVTFAGAGHYSYLEHLAETTRILDHFFKA